MFKILVGYPSYEEEVAIAERTTGVASTTVRSVLNHAEILRIQEVVRRVPAASSIIQHAVEIVRCTRPHATGGQRHMYLREDAGRRDENPAADVVNRMVSFGAGPRAVQYLLLGAKARALILGRNHVSTGDVRALTHPVLRHRIITNYAADAEGFGTDQIIDHILQKLPPHERVEARNGDLAQVLGS
jgi:MoxR-like ATPase